jgi:hypothetical protein
MRTLLPSFVSSKITKVLAATIAVILLASNFTVVNAQQQGEQLTSAPREIGNGTATAATPFQNTNDSFRVHVPNGWIIQDLNNTDSALSVESAQAYEILAQLCPDEEQQQQGVAGETSSANASGSGSSATNSTGSLCQGAQEEVIHIIRYLNFETDTPQPGDEEEDVNGTNNNNLTTYHLQKLEEVGYNNITTVNSTMTTVDLILPQTNETIAEMPAKIVEMTYTTAFAPDETRRGYFLLTATAATLPDLGTAKGYSVLYEGSPVAAAASSSSLLPTPLSPVIAQVFDSFELIAAPEVAQLIEEQEEVAAQLIEEEEEEVAADETDEDEDDDGNGGGAGGTDDDDDDDNGAGGGNGGGAGGTDDDDDDDNGAGGGNGGGAGGGNGGGAGGGNGGGGFPNIDLSDIGSLDISLP